MQGPISNTVGGRIDVVGRPSFTISLWRALKQCMVFCKPVAWLPLLFFSMFATWQLYHATDPTLPHWVSGIFLLSAGLLIGLRLGHDSRGRFSSDVVRLNKYLAEQNRDLAENNHALLKSLLSLDFDGEN